MSARNDIARAEVTADESGSVELPGALDSALILALRAERLFEESSRHVIPSSAPLWLSRAPEAGARPARAADDPATWLELADRFVSAPHASLQRRAGETWLRDEGSRNGTFVDGAAIEESALHDGAVIEAGRTFFVYRERQRQASPFASPELSTFHAGFAAQLRALEKIAPTPLSIVLRGESGTGKEVVARLAHRLSGRAGPFQAINCAALARSLAEAELFGYRKGAFSGANEDRPGLIRSAQGGTLFLDEIGDLPLPMQALFLRVLQENEVLPVGATKPVPVELRLIVATHRDLDAMADAGEFRPDLLARISGFSMLLPALRDRREDLGSLVAALLQRQSPGSTPRLHLSLAAARALFRHRWPLNVRELEKVLSLAATLAVDGRLSAEHFPLPDDAPAEPAAEAPLSPEEEAKRDDLLERLKAHHGNVSAVARELGKARIQIHRWMRRYQIDPSQFR